MSDERLLAEFWRWRWPNGDVLIKEDGGGSVVGDGEDDLLEVGWVRGESIEMVWRWCE